MRIVERRMLRWVPALLLALVLVAGCAPAPQDTDVAAPNVADSSGGTTIQLTLGEGEYLGTIADVVAKVKPSVVAINTEIVAYDFFNRPLTQEAAGSGWIISEDGYIVTNNHVVEGAKTVEVTLDDGRTFEADNVYTDPLTDLAVVKIDENGLPVVAIGDSSALRVGDDVVAIGNSLGRGISATSGIASALGVSLAASPGQTLLDLVQTDAAINPGNSGGPLVNMAGEVVGINSVKIAQVGVEGMGYAISINEALPVIKDLMEQGEVIRPWLGIGLYTMNAGVAARYNLSVDTGVLVTEVVAGSPADQAGLKAGDVIVEFDGVEIRDSQTLVDAIGSHAVGDEVGITYWREDSQATTSAVLTSSQSG